MDSGWTQIRLNLFVPNAGPDFIVGWGSRRHFKHSYLLSWPYKRWNWSPVRNTFVWQCLYRIVAKLPKWKFMSIGTNLVYSYEIWPIRVAESSKSSRFVNFFSIVLYLKHEKFMEIKSTNKNKLKWLKAR